VIPVVYFIQQNNGPVKIGYAADVLARYKDLQVANPYQLRTRAMIPSAKRSLEGAIHFEFQVARIKGEWFDMRRCVALEVFVDKALRMLTKHVELTSPPAASAMREHLYIPAEWLPVVQETMETFAADLLASMDESPRRKCAIPADHLYGHDTCRCGGQKLKSSRRCHDCWVAEQSLHPSGREWG
jgi:hypothetical protein